MSVYGLSEKTVGELQALLGQQGGPNYRPQQGKASQQVCLVQCTSSSLGTFPSTSQTYYNGLVKLWRSDDGVSYSYVEDPTIATCYLMEAASGTLVNGQIYLCIRSGLYNKIPVFITVNGGGLVTVRVVTNFCPSGSSG